MRNHVKEKKAVKIVVGLVKSVGETRINSKRNLELKQRFKFN